MPVDYALNELSGVPVGLFSLRTNDQTPTGRDHKFLQILFEDVGGSIADLAPPNLSARLSISDPTAVGDCFMQSGRVIVSERFKTLMERFDVPNTEFFPLKVFTIAAGVDYAFAWEPGEELSGYWLMNSWNRVPADDYIDFDASELRWQKSFVGHRPPWFSGWQKLVLLRQVKDHLFGFADNLPLRRFVSDELRDAAKAAGLRAGIYVRQ